MRIDLDGPLVLAGAGKMGGALLSGWLAKGLDPRSIVIVDPAPPPEVDALITKQGLRRVAGVPKLDAPPAVLLMAVKPQVMQDVFSKLAKLAGPKTTVVSIAAGRTIKSFEAHLAKGTAVVRTMPNTPASIGRGITVCVANRATSAKQRKLCEALLSAVGDVGWVADEALIDAVTAVSGSGPAYIFLLTECLAKAGVEAGLPAELAMRLARATVTGSGELMRLSPDIAPSTLRQNVTSPGGTTAAALSVLMAADDGLQQLMTRAVAAAKLRGQELA